MKFFRKHRIPVTGVNNIPGIEEARLGFDRWLAFIWSHMLVGDQFLRRSAIFTEVSVKKS